MSLVSLFDKKQTHTQVSQLFLSQEGCPGDNKRDGDLQPAWIQVMTPNQMCALSFSLFYDTIHRVNREKLVSSYQEFLVRKETVTPISFPPS